MPDSAPGEKFTIALDVPAELGDVEQVATFMGYPKGGIIDSTSAEFYLKIGIPRESKYEAIKVTDRPGDTLYFIVLGRVRPDFGAIGQDFDDE